MKNNQLKILLIGSGGREHSLALKLKESNQNPSLFIAPGNAGTAQCGTNVQINDTDIENLLKFAIENEIDLTVVGPEAPLVKGIVNTFNDNNLNIIGPDEIGAQLEGSKAWSKAFMEKYDIPTASYKEFTNSADAKKYIDDTNQFPIVIKADGLAAGKGVTIAATKTEAYSAIEDAIDNDKFQEAGKKIIIEDFLDGEEASIFAFCDGKTILPMTPAQDHKAIFDGDKGPNTGGMGAYSPTPLITDELFKTIKADVFDKVLKGFKEEKIDYRGIVYAGIIVVKGKPLIIEFNARFGDPETQVVLPRLKNDLASIFQAMTTQTLDTITLEWKPESAVCVVLASGGYPDSYEKGKEIKGTADFSDNTSIQVIHAGTRLNNKKLETSGGRVLGVVGIDSSLKRAIDQTYSAVEKISFEKSYHRKDIGHKALARL
ncbi:phosphoribosylamine--glycine ligase [bacterium]|jgi:phosphoribosylamine---glycine ligase|nr:phosphoribosylamine--glycine ligase [bacterium]